MVGPRYHAAAGAILAEREGMALTSARADVEGHLTDLMELLEARLPDERGPA